MNLTLNALFAGNEHGVCGCLDTHNVDKMELICCIENTAITMAMCTQQHACCFGAQKAIPEKHRHLGVLMTRRLVNNSHLYTDGYRHTHMYTHRYIRIYKHTHICLYTCTHASTLCTYVNTQYTTTTAIQTKLNY